MFAPPEPKVSTERILAAGVVPLYSASASQKALWDIGQKKHHRALAAVVKSTDQNEPAVNCDVSMHRAWERSKAFQEDQQLRQIAVSNKKLIGSLANIVSQPSNIARLANQPKHKVPPRGREAEKRRVKEVTRENELLVKRLLNVKPSLNRVADERDYARHRRNLDRMKKVPAPGQPARGTRQLRVAIQMDTPKQPLELSGDGDVEAGTFIPCSTVHRTLPPMPRHLTESRSAPALTNHVAGGSGGSRGSGRSAACCELPPISRGLEEEACGSWRKPWRPSSTTSCAVSEVRQFEAAASVKSSTCRSSLWLRSPRTVEDSMEDDQSLGRCASPPDTPALAKSIVEGTLPPPSPPRSNSSSTA